MPNTGAATAMDDPQAASLPILGVPLLSVDRGHRKHGDKMFRIYSSGVYMKPYTALHRRQAE